MQAEETGKEMHALRVELAQALKGRAGGVDVAVADDGVTPTLLDGGEHKVDAAGAVNGDQVHALVVRSFCR